MVLSSNQLDLLREIVSDYEPSASSIAESIGRRPLTLTEIARLRSILVKPLLLEWNEQEQAFSQRGAWIESIIDALRHY